MKHINYTQKDFAWVKMSADQINAFPDVAIKSIKEKLEIIKKIKSEDKTFENIVYAYDRLDTEEGATIAKISTLEMCSDKLEVRDAARNTIVKISNMMVDIAYDIKMFQVFSDYYNNNYKAEKETLISSDIKLCEDMMRGFLRMGFHLPAATRNKIKSIEKKISKLASDYDARLSEDNSFMLCDESEMIGVPENIKNSFEKMGDRYKIGISYPEYGPYIKYAENREKRKEVYRLFNNQGGEENINLLKEMVKLRKEKAEILGFKNHAEYVVGERMSKNTKNVYSMLNDLIEKLKSKKDLDIKELKDKALEIDNIKKIESYDTDFYTNKIKQEKYIFDEQKIREYFPLEHVMDSMFKMFGELFAFEIRKTEIKLWHKDANLFELYDKKTRQVLSYLAFDLFPRAGKFGHACMIPVINGSHIDDENYRAPLAVIVCNFSKPQKIRVNKKLENRPSLLSLGEVETLFHEFGHALHQIMSKTKHDSQSGTNVVWDFVEGPSQIMEEWVADEKSLKKISKHHITGKSLPKIEIDKIKSMEKFMKATFYTRQVIQSLFDMDLYTYKTENPVEHFQKLVKKHLIEMPKDVMFISRFAHIARGYDAGYYSYIWAERISKDMYSHFKKSQNNKAQYKKIGEKYRKEILEMGSSRDEAESVKAFLGREINNNAFLESIL